jgi:two-component system, OmpR family, heavy metal sensor histidine kinase CusS
MIHLAIRWRLTLWYSSILALILVAFSGGVYFLMRTYLINRLDRNLREELAAVDKELEESSTTGGLGARLHRRFGHYEHVLFDVRYLDGSPPLFSRHLGESSFPAMSGTEDEEQIQFTSYEAPDEEHWRIASRGIRGPDGPLLVRVAAPLSADEHELQELTGTLFLGGLMALVAAVAGGYFLARRSLAPVERMAQAAHEISVKRLDRRLEVKDPHDELGRLAATFNDMIARLERSFADMQQFTADAAHELRTPITVIRSEAEVALRAARSAEEYRKTLESLLEEAEHLTLLADQLLYLCREDAGSNEATFADVQLDELINDVAAHMGALSKTKGVLLTVNHVVPCQVQGDAESLRRLLFNLLENSLKHTPENGKITLELNCLSGEAEIVVTDTGTGISAEHLPKVFNRFYRADPARQSGGTGLGLSICQAIVDSHDGSIRLGSESGKGTEVSVRLPL